MPRAQINLTGWVRDPLLWICVGLVILYLALVSLRPAGFFWTIDEGGKLVSLQSMLQTGDPAAALLYPQRAQDPTAQFVPIYFRVERGNQVFSWWGINFPLVTLPFYRLLGWMGLYVLPAVFGGLCALFSGLIVRLLAPAPAWLAAAAAGVTGLATPVAFYSTMFWEHTLAVGLALGGVYFLLKAEQQASLRLNLLAAALGSLAVWFRTELAVFLFGCGLALLILGRWRGGLAFAAGFGVAALPWLAFNYLATGSLLTNANVIAAVSQPAFNKIGLNLVPEFLFNAPFYWAYLFDQPILVTGTLLVGLGILAPIFRRTRWLAILAYPALALICGMVIFSPEEYRSLHGFFLASPPILLGAWLYARRQKAPADPLQEQRRLLAWMVACSLVVFGIIYVLRAWSAAGGLQFGPRYLLAFYPLLVAAGAVGLAHIWPGLGRSLRLALAGCAALFVLCGVGIQVRGAMAERAFVELVPPAAAQIRQLAQDKPVVIRGCELSMLDPELYWKTPLFSITRSDLISFATQARKNGIESFYRVSSDLCADLSLAQVRANRLVTPGGISAWTCSTAAVLSGDFSSCPP